MAGQPVRVGTADDNDLVLTDDTVSRHHCELEPVDGGMRVRDVGSTNGVFVGGVRVYDALVRSLRRARPRGRHRAHDSRLGRDGPARADDPDASAMSSARRRACASSSRILERIAATDVTLLVEGETGTGKDLVAESVHRASARSGGPFVVFDCGAVSPTLVESELFGHERGAFTGATQAHAGVFEQADGGTLFLDEIGELPQGPAAEAAARAREACRCGASGRAKIVAFDVRIIAATNRNLNAEVQRGAFREDLYFRLAAAHVAVPPLRERMEDLPLLGRALPVARATAAEPPRGRTRGVGSAPRAPLAGQRARAAQRRPAPVRDAGAPAARVGRRPAPTRGHRAARRPAGNVSPLRVARREASDRFERDYIAAVLRKTGGNVTRAAASRRYRVR